MTSRFSRIDSSFSFATTAAFASLLVLAIALLGCTQKLKTGRLLSESEMAGLTYGETTYSETLLRWGEPDSIIIKDNYFLATWRGGSIQSIGVSLGGEPVSLLGTTTEGSFRNVTIAFEKNNMTYIKYIIDTDPIASEKWLVSSYWY